MSLTRRAARLRATAYKSRALAVAAEDAEAAEVAAAAEVADAVEAAEATEVVAYPGKLTAGARPDRHPVTLTNASTTQVIMAGSDKIDPADPCWLGYAC